MKSLTKLSIALAPMLGAYLSMQAAPVMMLGEEMALHFTGQAAIRSESNVLLRDSNKKSDMSYRYSPGIELDLGSVGVTDFNGKICYSYNVIEYNDLNDLDSENDDFNSVFNYKNANFKVSGGLVYREVQTPQDILSDENSIMVLEPGLLSRSVVNANAYAEWALSAKTKLGTGVTYADQNYSASGYSNYSSISVPVDFYYSLSAKTDLSLGYVYRPVFIGDGDSVDAVDSLLTLGLRGELMPKLTGYARFGWMGREGRSSSLSDKSGITMSASMNYEVSPLINVGTRIMRDLSFASLSGVSTIRTGLISKASYNISRQFSAGASVGYIKTEYQDNYDRDDDFIILGMSVSYHPNEYLNVTASYNHNANDSTIEASDYNNNILEVIASFRY